jgi:3-hydroxybutyrate dehydrogenase
MGILKGKTAVVTGSTSGVGLACARALAGAPMPFSTMLAPAPAEVERSSIESHSGIAGASNLHLDRVDAGG